MLLVVDSGFCAAHFLIEGLAFDRRVSGYVQLSGTVFLRPFFRSTEKHSADAVLPHILGNVDAGKVKVLMLAAEETGLYRDEALQTAFIKGSAYKAAGGDGIFQTGNKELVVRFRPVIRKGVVPDDPFPAFFSPAFYNGLMPDEMGKQRSVYFIRA